MGLQSFKTSIELNSLSATQATGSVIEREEFNILVKGGITR